MPGVRDENKFDHRLNIIHTTDDHPRLSLGATPLYYMYVGHVQSAVQILSFQLPSPISDKHFTIAVGLHAHGSVEA